MHATILHDRLFELCLVKGGYVRHHRVASPPFEATVALHKPAMAEASATGARFVAFVHTFSRTY